AEKNVYDTSRTIEQFSGAAGSIERLTVAVLVNEGTGVDGAGEPLTPQELTRVEALVRNAVGLDVERGDDITVVSIPFEGVTAPVEPVVEGPGIIQQLPQYQRPFITIVALVLAFILGLKTLRAVRTATEPAGALKSGQSPALGPVESAIVNAAAQPKLPESVHAQLLQRSAQTPDTAARVIRAWMKES
ncbi:MAG: flagellar M-ring protein FliF C-terminal domain-containing protein, partial [Longimicrobiales bacterium]